MRLLIPQRCFRLHPAFRQKPSRRTSKVIPIRWHSPFTRTSSYPSVWLLRRQGGPSGIHSPMANFDFILALGQSLSKCLVSPDCLLCEYQATPNNAPAANTPLLRWNANQNGYDLSLFSAFSPRHRCGRSGSRRYFLPQTLAVWVQDFLFHLFARRRRSAAYFTTYR